MPSTARRPRDRNPRRLVPAPESLEGRLALSGFSTLVAAFGGWHGRPSKGPTVAVAPAPSVIPQWQTPDHLNNVIIVRPPRGTGR